MQLCEYGCGEPAEYQFKNGKWCCSKTVHKCKTFRENTSKHKTGQKMSKEARKKMSIAKKGKSPWNKGKTGIYSKEVLKQMSIRHSGKIISKSQRKKVRLKIEDIYKRYPTFSKVEKMRYNPDKINEKEIQVHCKNNKCINSKEKNGWFTPTYIQLYERIRQIEKGNGGAYLYCCDECKQECPLYNLHTIPNNKKRSYTSNEYNIWREEVLSRFEYKCEYCEEPATDAHHSMPQKLDNILILDPDYGIACCEKCHYKYGHKIGTECSTGNLANKICN